MLKPQGYVIVTDVDGKTFERDSVTCCHCNRVVFVKPGSGCTTYYIPQLYGPPKEEAGAWCASCDKAICLTCHEDGRCLPLMRRIEQNEAMGRKLLTRFGVALLILLGWALPVRAQFIAGDQLAGVNVAVAITVPQAGGTTYDAGTASSLTTLSGTVRADAGLQRCDWTNSLGGSGSTAPSATWTISNIALTVGSNLITVTCYHSGGTTGTAQITVTRSASGGGGFTDAVGAIWGSASGGLGTGSCLTSATACTVTRALAVVPSPGTMILKSGTYTAGFNVPANVTVTAEASVKNATTWTCGSAWVVQQQTAHGTALPGDCGVVTGTNNLPLITAGMTMSGNGGRLEYVRVRPFSAVPGCGVSPPTCESYNGIVNISAENTVLDHVELWNDDNQGVSVSVRRLVTLAHLNIHDLGNIPSDNDTHGINITNTTGHTAATGYTDGIKIQNSTFGPNIGGDAIQENSYAYGINGSASPTCPACAMRYLTIDQIHVTPGAGTLATEEQAIDSKGTTDVIVHGTDVTGTGVSYGVLSWTWDPPTQSMDDWLIYDNYWHDNRDFGASWSNGSAHALRARFWNNVCAGNVTNSAFGGPGCVRFGDVNSYAVFNTLYLNAATSTSNCNIASCRAFGLEDEGSGNNIKNNLCYLNGTGANDRGCFSATNQATGGSSAGTPTNNYINANTTLGGLAKVGTSVTSTCSVVGNCPLFTNISTRDFTLQSGSPARNIGAAIGSHISVTDSGLYTPSIDALGHTRDTATPDAGAFEFQP